MLIFFKVRPIPLAMLILLAVFMPYSHAGDSATGAESRSPEERPISLSVQNEPLGQVLKKIETETELTFIIGAEWESVPVSVSLHQTPLHKGLKRILVNLNNVIIYEADNRVKIVILGKIEPGKGGSGPPAPPIYQPTPVYQQPGPAAEPEPAEPPESPEPPEEQEPIPEEKEEAGEADMTEAGNGAKAGENAAEDQEEKEAAEDEKPGGDATETPEKPAG